MAGGAIGVLDAFTMALHHSLTLPACFSRAPCVWCRRFELHAFRWLCISRRAISLTGGTIGVLPRCTQWLCIPCRHCLRASVELSAPLQLADQSTLRAEPIGAAVEYIPQGTYFDRTVEAGEYIPQGTYTGRSETSLALSVNSKEPWRKAVQSAWLLALSARSMHSMACIT